MVARCGLRSQSRGRAFRPEVACDLDSALGKSCCEFPPIERCARSAQSSILGGTSSQLVAAPARESVLGWGGTCLSVPMTICSHGMAVSVSKHVPASQPSALQERASGRSTNGTRSHYQNELPSAGTALDRGCRLPPSAQPTKPSRHFRLRPISGHCCSSFNVSTDTRNWPKSLVLEVPSLP